MAVDATGTPTTNFGFPRYNVSADAPSGQGLNAIIADIDSKLAAQFVHSEDTKVTNDVPVWDGSGWVYQKLAAAQLNITGSPTGAKFLRDDFSWANPSVGGVPFATTLPVSPGDEDECVYEASAADKIYWHLKYQASSSKWVKIGGPPLHDEVDAFQGTTSATYADLTTAGPFVTAPLAGNYYVRYGCGWVKTESVYVAYVSFTVGATQAVDADAALAANTGNTGLYVSLSRTRAKTLAATNVVKMRYRSSDADRLQQFGYRWIEIDPIFVS